MTKEKDEGKRKRTPVQQEHHGIDNVRDPKIRKTPKEESRKSKVRKLQKTEEEHHQQMETTRKEEEPPTETMMGKEERQPMEAMEKREGEDAEPTAEDRAAFAKRMTERQVAFYKSVMEEDVNDYIIPERLLPYYPRGIEAARAYNEFMREEISDFKAHAAARLEEYGENGYLEGIPPPGRPADVVRRLLSGK